MSRYYGYMRVTFTDGTTERIGGNRHRVADGLLTIYTISSDWGGSGDRDIRYLPLASIREFHWEGE